MTAREVLEMEAGRRGARSIVSVWNPDEYETRRYRVMPTGTRWETFRWFFGATYELALEALVRALPEPVHVEVMSDPFPEAHPYRRAG